jgi:hypothetical protein
MDSKTRRNDDDRERCEDSDDNQFTKHGMKVSREDAADLSESRWIHPASKHLDSRLGLTLSETLTRLDHTIRTTPSDHGSTNFGRKSRIKLINSFRILNTFCIRLAASEIIPALLHGDLWAGNAAQIIEDTKVG